MKNMKKQNVSKYLVLIFLVLLLGCGHEDKTSEYKSDTEKNEDIYVTYSNDLDTGNIVHAAGVNETDNQSDHLYQSIMARTEGIPNFDIDNGRLILNDNPQGILHEKVNEFIEINCPDYVDAIVYRADEKLLSVRFFNEDETSAVCTFDMKGNKIDFADVIMNDFPACCKEELTEINKRYLREYGEKKIKEIDISALDCENVRFNLDANSVIIYLDELPYRIEYSGNEDKINPDIIPCKDEFFGFYKSGKFSYASDNNYELDCGSLENPDMSSPSFKIDGDEASIIPEQIRIFENGNETSLSYATAYYYRDGNGTEYVVVHNRSWWDFGHFTTIFIMKDGEIWKKYSTTRIDEFIHSPNDIKEYISARENNYLAVKEKYIPDGSPLDQFVNGTYPAIYEWDGDIRPLYISDLEFTDDDRKYYEYSLGGEKVDLNNDGSADMILNGPYGGIYLYSDGESVKVLCHGISIEECLGYETRDGVTWVYIYDNTQNIPLIKKYYRYDKNGEVVDEMFVN